MRRSSRESKKPNVLTFDKMGTVSSQGSAVTSDETTEPTASDEEDFMEMPPARRVLTDKPKSEKRRPSASSSLSSEQNFRASTLFEGLQGNMKIPELVQSWAKSVEENRTMALTQVANLVLSAAGGKKGFVDKEVDLESLDSDGLSELLEEMIQDLTSSDGSKVYPLSASAGTKPGKTLTFRSRYSEFWNQLCHELQSDHPLFLNQMVDQLINMSCLAVVNVRHAVLEAVLQTGLALLQAKEVASAAKELADRQLSAERRRLSGLKANASGSNVATSTGKRMRSLEKSLVDATQSLEVVSGLIDKILNSIFLHRIKDSHETIRAQCVRYLAEWMLLDHSLCRDELVKYLGWACFEHSATVRLEAVHAVHTLFKNEDLISSLSMFVQRFLERFLEIATGDTHEPSAYYMVCALRVLQRAGFLDSLPSEKLDQIDVLVFDSETSERIRVEALEFMMDHTEGFEEAANEEPEIDESRQSKKAKMSAESKQLPNRHKTELQLETLMEFLDYHLGGESGLVDSTSTDVVSAAIDLFVKAGAMIPIKSRSSIFYRWEAYSSLLSKDNSKNTKSSLSKRAIVLSLIRSSIDSLRTSLPENSTSKGLKRHKDDVECVLSNWEKLQAWIVDEFATAAAKFRDNADEFRLSAAIIARVDVHWAATSKHAKSFMKLLQTFFDACRDEITLRYLLVAMKSLTDTDSCVRNEAHKLLSTQVRDQEQNLQEHIGEITSLSEKLSSTQVKKKSVGDLKDVDLILGCLTQLSEGIILIRTSHKGQLTTVLLNTMTDLVVATGHTAFSILLWRTRDIYAGLQSNTLSEENAEKLIDAVIETRQVLLSILQLWLNVGQEESMSNSTDAFGRKLRQEAFKMVGDVRSLFPCREMNYVSVARLAYSPSPEILASLRRVFESEGNYFRQSLAEDGEVGESTDQIVGTLVSTLLEPLSKSLMYDLEHLNRRQAAAIICHVVDPFPAVQETVGLVLKKLKEGDFVKFLEIEMVALKSVFAERVAKWVQDREALEAAKGGKEELQQISRAIEEGYETMNTLSKKLSGCLGVGKLRSNLSVEVLSNFLKTGIDVAIAHRYNFGFLSSMEWYIRFLEAPDAMSIYSYFESAIGVSEEVPDIDSQSTDCDEIARMRAFRVKLCHAAGKSSPKPVGILDGRRRKVFRGSNQVAKSRNSPKSPKLRISDLNKKPSTKSQPKTSEEAVAARSSARHSSSKKRGFYRENSDSETEVEEAEEDDQNQFQEASSPSKEIDISSLPLGLMLEDVAEPEEGVGDNESSSQEDLFANLSSKKKYKL